MLPPYIGAMVTNETVADVGEARLLQPYSLEDGVCNAWMADMPSVLDRFKFVVNYLTHNGFYVALVQQTNNEPITLVRQDLDRALPLRAEALLIDDVCFGVPPDRAA